MKIKYEFATETIEIEVSAEWAEILMECDREEYNNQHKETRRHSTLDNGFDDGEWVACEDFNPFALIDAKADVERINKAFSALTEDQKDLVQKVFIEGMSVNDYAASRGVVQSAISRKIMRIRKKLKKLL